jgi:hypothetical protein
MTDDIPWDEIDAEMRPLIRLLNEREGIRTLSCCCGHDADDAGSVAFTAASLEVLSALLLSMPPASTMTGLPRNLRFRQWECMATVYTQEKHLTFALIWRGHPETERYAMQREIESALRRNKS